MARPGDMVRYPFPSLLAGVPRDSVSGGGGDLRWLQEVTPAVVLSRL